jgi:hypothetical protein
VATDVLSRLHEEEKNKLEEKGLRSVSGGIEGLVLDGEKGLRTPQKGRSW